MAKGDRVTIRKEGSHYVINVNGRGMELAMNKREALWRQRKYQKQLHPWMKVKYSPTKVGYGSKQKRRR
jgi:hypothetical protein